jgi:hypothetical protein
MGLEYHMRQPMATEPNSLILLMQRAKVSISPIPGREVKLLP